MKTDLRLTKLRATQVKAAISEVRVGTARARVYLQSCCSLTLWECFRQMTYFLPVIEDAGKESRKATSFRDFIRPSRSPTSIRGTNVRFNSVARDNIDSAAAA